MKKATVLLYAGIILSTFNLYSQGPTIDIDHQGNISIAGYLQDSLTFSNGETIHSSFDPWAINIRQSFLLQMDANRNLKWHILYDQETFDDFCVKSDDDGNVYLGGKYKFYLPLDTSLTLYTFNPKYVLIKYDSEGTYQWHIESNSSPYSHYDLGLETDSSGNVYFIGSYWQGPFTLGNSDTITSETDDIGTFVAKFDQEGNSKWIKQVYGSADYLSDIEVTRSGDCYITGAYLDGGPAWIGNDTINSDGGIDAFIARLDSTGEAVWFSSANSTGRLAAGSNIGVNEQNRPTMVGGFTQSVSFQPLPPLVSNDDAASTFIANYDTIGYANWAIISNPSEPSHGGTVISMDQNGSNWLIGESPMYFEPTQIDGEGTFLIKVDSLGGVVSSSSIINGYESELTIDNEDNVYVIGSFFHEILVDGQLFSGATSEDLSNYFIVKYNEQGVLQWVEVIKNPYDFVGSIKGFGNDQINIYPNPCDDIMNIDLISVDPASNKFNLRLYSTNGSLLLYEETDASTTRIDVSNLNTGIYFVEIETSKTRIIRKLIKR